MSAQRQEEPPKALHLVPATHDQNNDCYRSIAIIQ